MTQHPWTPAGTRGCKRAGRPLTAEEIKALWDWIPPKPYIIPSMPLAERSKYDEVIVKAAKHLANNTSVSLGFFPSSRQIERRVKKLVASGAIPQNVRIHTSETYEGIQVWLVRPINPDTSIPNRKREKGAEGR